MFALPFIPNKYYTGKSDFVKCIKKRFRQRHGIHPVTILWIKKLTKLVSKVKIGGVRNFKGKGW